MCETIIILSSFTSHLVVKHFLRLVTRVSGENNLGPTTRQYSAPTIYSQQPLKTIHLTNTIISFIANLITQSSSPPPQPNSTTTITYYYHPSSSVSSSCHDMTCTSGNAIRSLIFSFHHHHLLHLLQLYHLLLSLLFNP